jgi:hypothetical protein
MLVIVTVLVLAFVVTYVMKSSRILDNSQLSESRTALLTMGVQIICGDCSGDGERPVKTYLDRHGNCSQCGGHSYMLASSRILYAQHMVARLSVVESVRDNTGGRLSEVSF